MSVPDTPEIDAAVERLHRTLMSAGGMKLQCQLARLRGVIAEAVGYLESCHIGAWSNGSEKLLEAKAKTLTNAIRCLLVDKSVI